VRKVGFMCAVVTAIVFKAVLSGAPAKPGTYVPVPLTVTVNACDESKSSEICGDGFQVDEMGNTVYTDGQDGVQATIDQYGNLIVNFQTTRAKIRGLVYKYGSISAPPGNGSNHYLSTIGSAMQAMPNGQSITAASCPLYDDDSGAPQYRHSFSRDCQSGFGPVGSPLVVTRTSGTTWDVEPDVNTGAMARVFGITVKGRQQLQDFGGYSLPFSMTVTAK
jgi:hypothetical protein